MNTLKINYFKIFQLFFLGSLIFILTGCNLSNKKEETVVELPTVKSKYKDEQIVEFNNRVTDDDTNRYEGLTISKKPLLTQPEQLPSILYFDSNIHIEYPKDGVKGVYVTASNITNEEYLNYIIDYINKTELNAIVIDFKDDYGNITANINSDNPLVQKNVSGVVDMPTIMKKLENNKIYPIARIVTFKDHMLSDSRPDLSFHDAETGEVWQSEGGEQFINPFLVESWQYNVDIAVEAAKMGFKDIQFDYVRFPDGFDVFGKDLKYDLGNYSYFVSDDPEQEGIERVIAISDFLNYASEHLKPYGVDVSADVFGYTAIANDAADVRGIGQDFARMAEKVDVISSMIYPSHWGEEFFGLTGPDLYPYEVVSAYMDHEQKIFSNVENDVRSRPWLQDFTYPRASGLYLNYGPDEVQAQINALYDKNVHEYLLWNASGEYSEGVDYDPSNSN